MAWCDVSTSDTKSLERAQRAAAHLIADVSVANRLPHDLLLARAGLDPLRQRRRVLCGVLSHKLREPPSTRRRLLPLHLAQLYDSWQASTPQATSELVLRSTSARRSRLPRPRTELFRRSPFYYSLSVLNSVPSDHLSSISALKSYLSSN